MSFDNQYQPIRLYASVCATEGEEICDFPMHYASFSMILLGSFFLKELTNEIAIPFSACLGADNRAMIEAEV